MILQIIVSLSGVFGTWLEECCKNGKHTFTFLGFGFVDVDPHCQTERPLHLD